MNPDEPAARAAEIRALRADGWTIQAIAARLGVSRSRVYQILGADRATEDERAARARFPMCRPALALRLARRFPDAAAVCAAEDRELASIRHMAPQQLRALRARYPHRASVERAGQMDDVLALAGRSAGAWC